MFEFDSERPSKIVAANTITIRPDRLCDPTIWTWEGRTFQCRMVFGVFSTRQCGGRTIRFYPLNPNPSKPPPVFVITEKGSDFTSTPATHIAYEHEHFVIIRPLLNIFYRAKWAVEKGNPYYAPGNLRTLVRHLQRCGMVEEEWAGEIEERADAAHELMEQYSFREAHEACRETLRILEGEVLKHV